MMRVKTAGGLRVCFWRGGSEMVFDIWSSKGAVSGQRNRRGYLVKSVVRWLVFGPLVVLGLSS